MQVRLGHGRLVRALDAPVQAVVGGLEGHLHEGVRREAHRGDKVLAVRAKVEALELVLLDQVRQPGLGESHGDTELGNHVPLELAWGRVDVPETLGVALGRVRAGGRPQGRGLAVDGPRKAQDGVGVEVAREAQHGVAVDARVLKVDAGAAVLAHDDLQLVVPAVRAGADLDALLDLARAAEHILAEGGRVGGLGVVQADHKQGRVDDAEAVGVVGARLPHQDVSQARPDLPVLGAQDTQGALGSLLNRRLGGIVDDGL